VKRLLFVCLAAVGAVVIGHAQTPLDPAKLLNPGTDSWPSYNGDYSGRRFSTLTKINDKNVGALSLAWVYRVNLSDKDATTIKGTPIVIDGVMYLTVPDHVWAIDARTGRQLWHHAWTSKGGIHIGNRGVAVLGDALFYETPDCTLVSLNIKDGSERWHKQICDLEQFYYGSVAPIPVKNHIIAGVSGDDLDVPGYLQAHDPVTGEMQWRWYAVPQKQGDPGSDTWPNEEAGQHGGGMTWQPVTYDPELNLLYVTTGNPQPVIAFRNREGANLFTASIVALNPDTGKMVWYFQSSPNDTHDWDATQTAVLIDDVVDGRPRKLLAQASRNGMYFLLDRTNGKAIVSSDYAKTNWSKGYDAKGQPVPNPAKKPQVDGVLVTPDQGGATNWPSPSFSPATGLFYVAASRAFSIFYIYDPGENPQGWGGTDRGGWSESMLQAIDYKTGKIRWSHRWDTNTHSGLLTTAGNLLFAGGNSQDLVALNATTGDAIWHTRLGNSVSNGPITYEMDGRQYVIVGAGDTLFAFVMNNGR
jgi:alcohol dehydrogenase (cytochrome c)